MCGIFGIIIVDNVINIYNLIINGLIQLQNRGYDSAGIALIDDNSFQIYKHASSVNKTAIDKLKEHNVAGSHIKIGMGHNRWATHGQKNDTNAHPHLSNNNKFAIVHNGIIENYLELKQMLVANGFIFYSQTDTEIIANLIEYNYTDNTVTAIAKTIALLRGTFGLVIQSLYEPNKLFCVKNGSPLLIGENNNCAIVTSEQSGFCNMVDNYVALHSDDICVITHNNNKIKTTLAKTYIKKNATFLMSELSPAPYRHWTLKEIYDQPHAVSNSINKGGRIKNNQEVKLGGLEQHVDILKNITNLILLGCGTSYFSAMYGVHFFKELCNFNTVQVFDGADFAKCDMPKFGTTAIVLISQSGETKDMHRCIGIAKDNNMATIGIINVVDSLIAREVDCGIYCNAGKEVGVASTKAFTCQVVCLSMAAMWFSNLHKKNNANIGKHIRDLQNLSNDIKNTLEKCNEKIAILSKNITGNNMFILGKGRDECIAKEGSLKIKEISYIHAEGYSTSSLKHGPFALLDNTFPVIILDMDDDNHAKTTNCYHEVLSRNSPIIYITNNHQHEYDNTILIPKNETYASLLGVMPLQLLAYNISINRGINPDTPKNLAKVVTVE